MNGKITNYCLNLLEIVKLESIFQKGILPLESSESRSSDLVVKKEHERRERTLLYVSATRAKNDVLVISYSRASRFL